MTVHLVYSVPYPEARCWLAKPLLFYSRAAWHVPQMPSWYRYGWLPGLPDPLPSPGSITLNLVKYLHSRATVRLYAWDERRDIKFGPNDIVLGHPHPALNTPIQRAVRSSRPCKAKVLMFPIHHGIASINDFALPLFERVDAILGIMGPYWYDTLDRSPFAPWKSKVTRLDMAIDAQQYPRVKRHFNAPGKRGFLYIGSNRPEKGPAILSKTMAQLSEFPRGWVGFGPDIPAVPRMSAYARLDQRFMSGLAEEYDIFVNTSVSDANPTTILEAMAWGFPVACTPESGYYNMPTIVSLNTQDIAANVKALRNLQYAPEEQLLALSNANRRLVETQYTWERFGDTVWQTLQSFL